MKASGYCEKCFAPLNNDKHSLCIKCRTSDKGDSAFKAPILRRLIIVSVILNIMLVYFLDEQFSELREMSIFLSMMLNLLCIVVILFYMKYKQALNIKIFFRNAFHPNWIKDLLMIIPCIVAAFCGSYMLFYALYPFVPKIVLEFMNFNFDSTILNYISICLLAPITEEIIFRGIVFQRLALKWNVTAGIIVSSVIFAIGHFPYNFIGAFAYGVVLCIVYKKSGSLYVPIVFHMIVNTFSTVISRIFPVNTTIEDITDTRMFFIYLLITAGSLLLIGHYYLKNKKAFTKIPYEKALSDSAIENSAV